MKEHWLNVGSMRRDGSRSSGYSIVALKRTIARLGIKGPCLCFRTWFNDQLTEYETRLGFEDEKKYIKLAFSSVLVMID